MTEIININFTQKEVSFINSLIHGQMEVEKIMRGFRGKNNAERDKLIWQKSLINKIMLLLLTELNIKKDD